MKRFLSLLAALVPITVLLSHCGSTVSAKRLDPKQAWREWRRDEGWTREHAAALAQLRAAGLDELYKKHPEQALAQLRAMAGTKPELHSAVAIVAADLAEKREGSAAARGLWLVAAEGASFAAKETPREVLLADNAAPARFMADLYNRAVGQFVNLDFAAGGLRGTRPVTIPAPGGDFTVGVDRAVSGSVDPAWFDELVLTDSVKIKGTDGRRPFAGRGRDLRGPPEADAGTRKGTGLHRQTRVQPPDHRAGHVPEAPPRGRALPRGYRPD